MFPLLLVALGIAFALSQNKKSALPPSPSLPLPPSPALLSIPSGTLAPTAEVWVNPNNDPMGATVVIPEAPAYRTTDQSGLENILRNGRYSGYGGSLSPQLIAMAEGVRRDAASKGYLAGNRAVVTRPPNDTRMLITIWRDGWRTIVK